jgi:hypothetical protein
LNPLADTSVALPAVLADAEDHAVCREAVSTSSARLAGHAWYEAFSVLTRLPTTDRVGPTTAIRLLASAFDQPRHLTAREHRTLVARLESTAVAGGSVYDALVGWAAVCEGVPLLTRDRRATATYRAIGVDVSWVV